MDFEINNGIITCGWKELSTQWKTEQEILAIFEQWEKYIEGIREKLVKESLKYIWAKRRSYTSREEWMSPETWFDCSGFITFLLKQFGLSKDGIRHSNEYFDRYWVLIHNDKVKAWDLVFFSWKGKRPEHMWMMISQTQYIHCSQKNKWVAIDDMIVKPIKIWDDQIYISNPIWFKRISLNFGDRFLII